MPAETPTAGSRGGAWRFVLRMAWRDSRASRRRLALFTSCVSVGIAALVALGSFGAAVEQAIELQARELLGADLSVGSRVRFTGEHEAFLATLGSDRSREISFTTMLVFPRVEGTRLVQVRALEGNFPYYGRLETEPADADARFRREGGVLVEESLLFQYGVSVGDAVKIGHLETRIAGALKKVPGETVAFATIAPRVYLRLAELESTGLLRDGSLARYRVLYRMPRGTDVEALVKASRPRLDALRLSVATVAQRKEDLGKSLRNLGHFLSLAGFVALLLGGVGIASAIQVHVQQKRPTVAILRCLGCGLREAFAVYLLQAMALGAAGTAVGIAAGLGVQGLLPKVAGDFIPVSVDYSISWSSVVVAASAGFTICGAFALLPLAAVRRVAPMAVLRLSFEPARRWDGFRMWTWAVLVLAIVGFAITHSPDWKVGLGFVVGLVVAFGALAGIARLTVGWARRVRLARWPFVIRQGWASVHRPDNRTTLLMVSLGLGMFLMLTLHWTQATLAREWVSGRDANRANAILFDIQPDQRDDVAKLVRDLSLPVLDTAPIVTMRLVSIRGRAVEDILAEPGTKAPGWALRREFRSTFSESLRESERVTAGTWIPRADPGNEPVPVSLEDGIAKELGVGLTDELVWNVQGVPLRTRVASLREVDWRRVQPNFFVVFPKGPLDDAPAVHVVVTRVDSAQTSATLQRAVVARFANVSVVDITLVLRTLDQVLEKVSLVIRFMASFTVATGLLVLVAAIVGGKWQRVRESILLRVLGATRRQVFRILLVEYAVLGALASATGVVLAWIGVSALAMFVFEVPFTADWVAAVVAAAAVTAMTVLTGLLASRGVTTHTPLEILRDAG